MTEAIEREDSQILQEVVFNERIVNHPKLGPIRLRIPNLEIQRKIDAVGRAKKKYLKEARDTITAEDGTVTVVPAYKSREQLSREYAELGWWTDVEKTRLTELREQHIQNLTELEVLGFESDVAIYQGINDIVTRLFDLCKEENGNIPEEVSTALADLSIPGIMPKATDINLLREHGASTEVDDLIERLKNFNKQYNIYIKLAQVYNELTALQSQESQLFSDSWQDQLQYYLRLAQVFYCTERAEDRKPIWPTLNAIEAEQNIELIRWTFSELNAFWQGISDEQREKMNKYSFTNPRNTEVSSSEGSPVPQESSPDGGSPEKISETSIVATVTADPSPTVK